jgi:SWI/SNF-related matrix-associated actin-dependent regulator 1 of chromatin subfamily A
VYHYNTAMFAVVPYSLVGKMAERLKTKSYQVVVCDESHFLKDGKSQRSKAVVPLLKAGLYMLNAADP